MTPYEVSFPSKIDSSGLEKKIKKNSKPKQGFSRHQQQTLFVCHSDRVFWEKNRSIKNKVTFEVFYVVTLKWPLTAF